MTTQNYKIGETLWYAGDLVTVTSEPFKYLGFEWQKAVTEAGREVTFPTPATKARTLTAKAAARSEQQAAFRRLRESQEGGAK